MQFSVRPLLRRRSVLAIVAATLCLGGCGQTSTSAAPSHTTAHALLIGTWHIIKVAATPGASEDVATAGGTLKFTSHTVQGNDQVNMYNAHVTDLSDGRIRVEPVSATAAGYVESRTRAQALVTQLMGTLLAKPGDVTVAATSSTANLTTDAYTVNLVK